LQHPLGRFYITASKDIQILLEQFTFEVKNISSYELGKSQYGKLPDMVADKDNADLSEGSQTDDLRDTLTYMQEEIGKVKLNAYIGVYL
jgi:hypothetical protein